MGKLTEYMRSGSQNRFMGKFHEYMRSGNQEIVIWRLPEHVTRMSGETGETRGEIS
jgi:hypothetical protein